MTLVRSPTISGRLLSSASTRSMPEKKVRPPGPARAGAPCRPPSGPMARMCAGVVPQQPPTRFSQPLRAKRSSCAASDLGRLSVLSFLVGQPGVGVAGDAGPGQLVQRADVVGHELRAGGAVQADGQQVRMRHRHPECVDGLPGEHGPHRLDGSRNHDRNRVADVAPSLLDAQQPGLDVARVLAGLDQQKVHATLDQRHGLLAVGCLQLAKVTPPVTLMALVVGPMEPATKRGLAGVENSSAACRASRAAVRFSSPQLS